MTEHGRFDSESLNELEKTLWELINHHSPFNAPPPLQTLIGVDNACDYHAEALVAYAKAISDETTAKWHNHPLLDHLQYCPACQLRLEELLAAQQKPPKPRRRPDADVDITLFSDQVGAAQEDETDIRSALYIILAA